MSSSMPALSFVQNSPTDDLVQLMIVNVTGDAIQDSFGKYDEFSWLLLYTQWKNAYVDHNHRMIIHAW